MATRFPSARYQAALATATGYRRWTRFTFSRNGLVRELEPTGGNLTQDARRTARWDGRLIFTGDAFIPERAGDLLTPFGTRVSVELGLELLDGTVSSVPYGVYEIGSAKAERSPSGRVVNIGLIDLSEAIDKYRFEAPFTVQAGTDLGTMINRVVTNRLGISPGVPAVGASLGVARVFGLDPGTGPWEEILDVLTGFDRTAWFDRAGQIQVGSLVPDPATSYPLDALTSLSVDFDTLPANVVVVRGEPEDLPPVFAVAMDTDPSSPTYAGAAPGSSPYGRRTEFFSSPLLTTASAAQSAAQTILARNLGAGATSTMTRPYDPSIDAGDVASRNGQIYAIDAVTVRLDDETSMQVREL